MAVNCNHDSICTDFCGFHCLSMYFEKIGRNKMGKKTGLDKLKLIRAGNAVYTVYQDFSNDLKRFGFVKRVENAKETFQLPKRMY